VGRNKVYVCDPLDDAVVTEQALGSFHGALSRERLVWRDANHWLRRWGVEPRAVDRVAPGQAPKAALWRALRAGRRGLARLQGRRVEPIGAEHSEFDLSEVVY